MTLALEVMGCSPITGCIPLPRIPSVPPSYECLTNALQDWNALPLEIRNPSYNAFRILLLIRTDLNLNSRRLED